MLWLCRSLQNTADFRLKLCYGLECRRQLVGLDLSLGKTMNVAKKYNRFSLVKIIGVPALCLLTATASNSASAQSGFVPIGKPQAPIIGGTPQSSGSTRSIAPSGSGSAFSPSARSKPSTRSKPSASSQNFGGINSATINGRPSFGGLNYAAPQNYVAGQKTAPASGSGAKTMMPESPASSPSSMSSPRSLQNASSGQSFGSSRDDSSSSSTSSKAQINVDTCSVHLMDEIMIPAKESGVLAELNVKEGDAVPARKIIGTIDATLLEIELERARRRLENAQELASDTSTIEVAKKKYALAKHEYEVAARLASKGSRSNQERMRAKYSKDTSAAEIVQAKMEQRGAMGQARVEEVGVNQIRQMIKNLRIESEFDGHVLELYKHRGEWVNKGDEIAHFARIDRVWVEGTVSSNECNVQDVMGQKTIITLRQAGGDTVKFNGTIVSIPLVMEGGGNRFRVKADVQNRFENGVWLLRPGAQLSMKIDLSPSTAKRSASSMNR